MFDKIFFLDNYKKNFFLFLILFIFFSLLLLFIPLEDKNLKLVGNYYSVIGDVSEILTEKNIPHISKEQINIKYNDFYQSKTITVKELETRFLAEDRRLDPFLSSLPSLFTAKSINGDLSISYIEFSGSPLSLFVKLNSIIPSNIEWQIYGFSIYQYIINIIVLAFCVFIFIKIIYYKNLFAFILLLPFIIVSFKSSTIVFYLFLLNFLYIYFTFNKLQNDIEAYFFYNTKKKPLFFTDLIFSSVLFFLSYIFIGIILKQNIFFFLFFTIYLLASFVAYMIFINIKMQKVLLSSHITFNPVSILRRARLDFSKNYLVLLLFVMPFIFFLNWNNKFDLPFYSKSEHAAYSHKNLKKYNYNDDLPNVSMYLIHDIYQKNILNNISWALPEINQNFTKNNFSLNQGNIEESIIEYYVFTHSEYHNIINTFKKDKLYDLIAFKQGLYTKNKVVVKNNLNFLVANIIFIIFFLPYLFFRKNHLEKFINFFAFKNKEIFQKS